METSIQYQKTVGIITILSGLLALACLWVGTLAVENNFEAFSDPVVTLRYAHHFELAKWFNILDLFGYYLLLLPLIFFLHEQFKEQTPWMNVITCSAVAYVMIGAIGAAVLAALWPEQMKDYLAAPASQKDQVSMLFKTTTLFVTQGLWNTLEVIFAAVWWLSLGKLFLLHNKALAFSTLLLGLATLMDSIGNLFDISFLADAGLNIYLVLGIVWPIWVGIWLAVKTKQSKMNTMFFRKPTVV